MTVSRVNGVNATDAWQLENDAIDRFNAGEFDSAIELFYKTTSMAPENAQLHFNFALALAKLGETKVAMDIIKKGLEIEGHDKQALRLLSILYEDLKNSEQNIRDITGIEWIGRFLKVKDLYLNYMDLDQGIIDMIVTSETEQLDLAELQLVDGKTYVEEASEPIMNDAIHEFLPLTLAPCYKHISLPSLDVNKFNDVMDYIVSNYNDLLEIDRSFALIWMFGKGKNKYDEAEYEDAANIFEAMAVAEPTNIAILFYCSKTLRDSGDMDMAQRSIDYLKRIIQLNPENALAWYEVSLSYAIIGDLQKELFCLQRAFDLGHSKEDFDRIMYLESITAPVDPFSN
ncbi:MAG TPA: tetratricopeptide repeat protein [Candidatus Lokiarchaeia archaeon]|nr:tetratricopeptide repeat protein [Candidatus Lokiarchaeia archaeon]